MNVFLKKLVIYAKIIVVDYDDGAYNHLLQLRMPNQLDYLVSYTGPNYLGPEGVDALVVIRDLSCKQVIRCDEHPLIGPRGYRSWICDTENVTLLEN